MKLNRCIIGEAAVLSHIAYINAHFASLNASVSFEPFLSSLKHAAERLHGPARRTESGDKCSNCSLPPMLSRRIFT